MIVKNPTSNFWKPMQMIKHNIGIEEKHKMATVGDYWDEEMVTQVVDLLKEYEDIFHSTFSEMKGTARELGEMKIQL